MKPKDFEGFRFGPMHSSDLNLKVVSSSGRYEMRTLPAPKDTVQDVPGDDGQYYFGSVYQNREITVNIAFDNVSEENYRKIKQLFATDKLQDLVFDEEPYKTYRAKIKNKIDLKSICFENDNGERVYKGDGKLQFVCYFPYAFGFEKYIVRASDYYLLHTPEQILCELSADDDFYFASRQLPAPAWIPADLRYHYNLSPKDNTPQFRDEAHNNRGDREWDPNDGIVWKTGFPTMEQVQNGELYFDLDGITKTLITTRGYWDNIPEWQSTAKLLTTPTLDYEQGLMYLPQYSKTNYVNMELGFNNSRPLIGTRVLVYNPGDVPINWELKITENKRSFWSGRGSERFRIRRFNVERLSIPHAVDWCGMKTHLSRDNEKYKYGNKYFKRKRFNINTVIENIDSAGDYMQYSDGNGGRLTKAQLLYMANNGSLPADKNWGMNIRIVFNCTDSNSNTIENTFEGRFAALPIEIANKINSYELDVVHTYHDGDLSPADLDNLVNRVPGFIRKGTSIVNHASPYGSILQSGYTINSFVISKIAYGNREDYQFDYPYENYTSDPITAKDDERLRKSSIGTEVRVEYPKSPNIAYNLHLDEYFYGQRLFNPTKTFFEYEELGAAHPKYCYFAEPIPREKLGDYIRLFYWQSEQLSNGKIIYNDRYFDKFSKWVSDNYYMSNNISYEKGQQLADRYEEVLKQCITEEEEFELYWNTLRELFNDFLPFQDQITSDDLFYEYVNCPLEYIPCDSRDLDYGQEVFNSFKYPAWMTPDYLEIDSSKLNNIQLIQQYMTAIGLDEKSLFQGQKIYYDSSLLEAAEYQSLKLKLDRLLGDGGCINDLIDDCYYINSDTRMIYALEQQNDSEFNYKSNKIVMNEAIVKGKWFKIPPGWSLITVEPVMDSNLYGGKRWLDSRPFDWGYGGDWNNNPKEVSQLFDFVYKEAVTTFKGLNYDLIRTALPQEERDSIDEIPFNKWYESKIADNENLFMVEYYYHKRYRAEQELLSIIDDYWNMLSPYYAWTSRKGVYQESDKEYAAKNGVLYLDQKFDVNSVPIHSITNHISDWWWYSCNYIWGNFPPIYWTTADMLNDIKIEYTPLYY